MCFQTCRIKTVYYNPRVSSECLYIFGAFAMSPQGHVGVGVLYKYLDLWAMVSNKEHPFIYPAHMECDFLHTGSYIQAPLIGIILRQNHVMPNGCVSLKTFCSLNPVQDLLPCTASLCLLLFKIFHLNLRNSFAHSVMANLEQQFEFRSSPGQRWVTPLVCL